MRIVRTALLGTSLALVACISYRWKARPLTELDVGKEGLTQRLVRLDTDSGRVSLRVQRLDFPYVYGQAEGGPGYAEVDLGRVDRIRPVDLDGKGRPIHGAALDLARVRDDPSRLSGMLIEFRTDGGTVTLRDARVMPGNWLRGRLALGGGGSIRTDLRDVKGLEVHQFDGPMTVFKTAALVGATVAVTALVVALTKESCPFVYVDRGEGWELVGEAYAGAAFRSTQRGDLLPLPVVGASESLSVRLRNEARETQYTDLARLVVVDHPIATRALSTFDGKVVLAGQSHLPVHATETLGRDVTRQLSAADDTLVETTGPDVAATVDSRLEDRVTVSFTPSTGEQVLEVVAGNTALLDLTFGRFFAAMGDRLGTYLEQGNAASAGPRIQGWREREGVDLIVELRVGPEWRRIAVIPTVGPAALRSIAVPLPALRDSAATIDVRLRSGLGFWRVDRVAIAARATAAPRVHHVDPVAAEGTGETDQRDVLGKVDGRYHTLSLMNESVDMTFALPARPGHRETRSVFLLSSGYYNVHPPLQSEWLPGTLKAIRDERGSFARFARDLTRVYESMATAPR